MRGRIALLLMLALGWLLIPATGLPQAAPPEATVSTLTAELHADEGTEASFRSGPIPTDGSVAVSAVTAGRLVEVRWQGPDGWSPWQRLSAATDHAPDPGSDEARSARPGVAEPVWAGAADAIEVRAADPAPVQVELVALGGDLGYVPTASPAASAEALAVWPPIVPRYRWDPNGDCEAKGDVRVAPRAERVFVHHTAIFPEYAPEEADDVLRAICIGHAVKRGFRDLGYNFVIDRYGTIYQGREGGILQSVVGAHAAGFNHGSIGVAIIGNFEDGPVPPAALDALDRLVAWLADLHGIEPYATSTHLSTGGATTRFEEGTVIELPAIVGHRDTGLDTACPGDHLYEHVRGGDPMAVRVRAILETSYGWAPTDRPPPSPAPPAPVPPSAGAETGVADPASAVTNRVREAVEEVSRGLANGDVGAAVRGIVKGAGALGAGEPAGSPGP